MPIARFQQGLSVVGLMLRDGTNGRCEVALAFTSHRDRRRGPGISRGR
jgi:hypothetical protein